MSICLLAPCNINSIHEVLVVAAGCATQCSNLRPVIILLHTLTYEFGLKRFFFASSLHSSLAHICGLNISSFLLQWNGKYPRERTYLCEKCSRFHTSSSSSSWSSQWPTKRCSLNYHNVSSRLCTPAPVFIYVFPCLIFTRALLQQTWLMMLNVLLPARARAHTMSQVFWNKKHSTSMQQEGP